MRQAEGLAPARAWERDGAGPREERKAAPVAEGLTGRSCEVLERRPCLHQLVQLMLSPGAGTFIPRSQMRRWRHEEVTHLPRTTELRSGRAGREPGSPAVESTPPGSGERGCRASPVRHCTSTWTRTVLLPVLGAGYLRRSHSHLAGAPALEGEQQAAVGQRAAS